MTIEVEDITETELLVMTKHLFRKWSIEEDVSVEKGLYACKVKDFAIWCITFCEDEPTQIQIEKDGMVSRLGVRPTAVDALYTLFKDPWRCAATMVPVWPILVLQHRPPGKHALAFVNLALTMGFRDEEFVQVQGSHEVPPGEQLTDGFIVAMFHEMARSIINTVAEHGLDKMHNEFSQKVVDKQEDMQPPIVIPPAEPGQMGY